MKRAGFKVECLYVDYGQPSRNQEKLHLRKIANAMAVTVDIVRVTADKRFREGEHLGRNLFLIASGLLFETRPAAGLCLGIHAGLPYYDCSATFFRKVAKVASELSSGRVALLAPLLSLNKTEIINLCRKEQVPLDLTYSCERGYELPCGRCPSCHDRKTHSV